MYVKEMCRLWSFATLSMPTCRHDLRQRCQPPRFFISRSTRCRVFWKDKYSTAANSVLVVSRVIENYMCYSCKCCGYDFQGIKLQRSSRCPECGITIDLDDIATYRNNPTPPGLCVRLYCILTPPAIGFFEGILFVSLRHERGVRDPLCSILLTGSVVLSIWSFLWLYGKYAKSLRHIDSITARWWFGLTMQVVGIPVLNWIGGWVGYFIIKINNGI